MKSVHRVVISEAPTSTHKKAKQQNLVDCFGKQKIKSDQELALERREILRVAADTEQIKQNALRLVVQHDLPLALPTYVTMNSLIYSANPMAARALWESPTTTANHIRRTFRFRRTQLSEALQRSLTKIHITTDTWRSPNKHELQAVTAHWLRPDGKVVKALLGLPEMLAGHAGVKVATEVIKILDIYGIKHQLGYTTTDNATCNDTMCCALSETLGYKWDPIEHRLRCTGHSLNLPMQAFLFAKNKEAIDEAIRQSETSYRDADEEIVLLSKRDSEGWLSTSPHKKVHAFGRRVRSNEALHAEFKRLAGRSLYAPNDTRWHSWFEEFYQAYELRDSVNKLIHNHPNDLVADHELTAKEWDLIAISISILHPFKIATKKLEGDAVTLDLVQHTFDYLAGHLSTMKERYKHNVELCKSLMTCWYAFDKYYKLLDDSAAYVSAILLHPNRRKNYLLAVWKASWMTEGVKRARELWYQQLDAYNATNTTIETTEPDDAAILDDFTRWEREVAAKQKLKGVGIKDEFDRFIDAPPDTIDFATRSVIQWWIEPAQREVYPLLSQHAINVFTAQAMSAESERVFSGARRIVSWSRASLSASMIEVLECLKHWQTSGVIDEEFVLQGNAEVDESEDDLYT